MCVFCYILEKSEGESIEETLSGIFRGIVPESLFPDDAPQAVKDLAELLMNREACVDAANACMKALTEEEDVEENGQRFDNAEAIKIYVLISATMWVSGLTPEDFHMAMKLKSLVWCAYILGRRSGEPLPPIPDAFKDLEL